MDLGVLQSTPEVLPSFLKVSEGSRNNKWKCVIQTSGVGGGVHPCLILLYGFQCKQT